MNLRKLVLTLGIVCVVVMLSIQADRSPFYLLNNTAVTSSTTNTALTSAWIDCDYNFLELRTQIDDTAKVAIIVDYMYGTDTTMYVSTPQDTLSTLASVNTRGGKGVVLRGYGVSQSVAGAGYSATGNTAATGTATNTSNTLPGANRMRVRAVVLSGSETSIKLNVALIRRN